jgi:hypothetical protein
MDFEMHTVHLPTTAAAGGYIAAALGVMFDRNNYNKNEVTAAQITAIDNFFDSLFVGITPATLVLAPTSVKYGELLMALDTDRRWV